MREKRYKHRDYVGNLKGREYLQGEALHGNVNSVFTLYMRGGKGGIGLIPGNYVGMETPENH
jgi:hypothetical protein